jgi:hypothetical protein
MVTVSDAVLLVFSALLKPAGLVSTDIACSVLSRMLLLEHAPQLRRDIIICRAGSFRHSPIRQAYSRMEKIELGESSPQHCQLVEDPSLRESLLSSKLMLLAAEDA